MRYTVSLDRVIGMYENGKYRTGGTFLFQKYATLTDAKNSVSEAFKNGYYNHATISDREEETEIERFKGEDWRTAA